MPTKPNKKRNYNYTFPKFIGIYKITNKDNGDFYIGKSVDIFTRWAHHLKYSQMIWKQTHLYNAMRKYGIDKFTFEIMTLCKEEQLTDYEVRAIQHFKPVYNEIMFKTK